MYNFIAKSQNTLVGVTINFCSTPKKQIRSQRGACWLPQVTYMYFYSESALFAVQSSVITKVILSVCLSVCMSVRHVPVLCPDEWRYDRVVFSVW